MYAGGWFNKGDFTCKDCFLDAVGWVDYPHPGSVVGWGEDAWKKREALLKADKARGEENTQAVTMQNAEMS